MDALPLSKILGSWGKQELCCLHHLFWGCLWPFGGVSVFIYVYPFFVDDGGFFLFSIELGFSAMRISIGSSDLRFNSSSNAVHILLRSYIILKSV